MKLFFRIASYSVIALVFCIALSGCTNSGKNSKDKDKVVIWSFESEDLWKPAITEFNKINEKVEVLYQQQTLDSNYENRLLNSMLSGGGPDILAMPNDWVYRHKEKLVPMPDILASEINLDSLYVPAIKQSVYFNQKIYALSPSAEPLMVYYNPKMLDDISEQYSDSTYDISIRRRVDDLVNTMPKVWTDWIDLAKYLTKKDSSGNIIQSGAALGTSNVLNSQDILYLMMMQNQTQIISDNLKLATFNLPKNTPPNEVDYPGRKAIEFYVSFSDPTSENYIWNDSLGDSLEAFTSGKVAMIFGFSNLQNYFEQKFPEFKYKKAFVPQQSQDSNKIVDFAKFNAYGISKLSKYPDDCWQMVKELSSGTGIDFTSSTNLYTSLKSSYTDISILDRDSNNPEKLSLVTSKSLVKGRYPAEFDSHIRSAIASVNQKAQTSAAALDTAAELITVFLNKATW